MKTKCFLISLIILFVFYSCKSNKNRVEEFKTPAFPVVYEIDSPYHKINSIDTPFNLDDTTKKIIVRTSLMDKTAIKKYGLDTVKFKDPFYYSGDNHIFSWLFGGIGSSTSYHNQPNGEKMASVDVSSKVSISTNKRSGKDGEFRNAGVYMVGLYTAVIATSKLNDTVLFAIGHPIKIRSRVTEVYDKIDEKDSVKVRVCSDEIDSTKMLYFKLEIKRL